MGAGHAKGIREQWSFAGTLEAAREVAGLMETPGPNLAGSFGSKAIAGIGDGRLKLSVIIRIILQTLSSREHVSVSVPAKGRVYDN